MNKIKQLPIFIFLVLLSASVTAQTDTGGGMGGTGISHKPIVVDPVMSQEPCTKDKSIAVYQLKSATDNKVKEQGYACSGQILKTKAGEIIELNFRSGEKIKILENSHIVIEKAN